MMFDPIDLLQLLPLFVLILSGLALILADAFFDGADRSVLAGLAAAGAVLAGLAAVFAYRNVPATGISVMSGMLRADKLAFAVIALASFTTAAVAILGGAHQRAFSWESGEFFGLLTLSTAGIAIIAMAADLVTVFIGVELMSIGVYAMTALRRRSRRGNEAAMKYFLTGAFATGFLLYGMALIYGALGTSNLLEIASRATGSANPWLLIAGTFFLVIAFGFKIGAVPFHMWAPDAYEGAPTPVTAYMAAAVKSAALVAMLRVFGEALGGDVVPFGTFGWASPLVIMAALTITIGNLAAVRQDNIKRMLAYSSVSHGGMLLVGLAALGLGAASAKASLVFYLIAYSLATLGAFAVMVYVGSAGRERTLVSDFTGLGAKHPAAALVMTICLLSFGGMPPTAGFFAKFNLFRAAMEVSDGQLFWLVLIGVVNSAVSIYYYLRIVTAMFFRESPEPMETTRTSGVVFTMAASALLVIVMGLLPGYFLGIGQ